MDRLFFDEEEVVEELKARGYRVIDMKFLDQVPVNTIRDLVSYFYARRLYYNEDRKFPESRNFKEDTKFLGSFIKEREKLGLSRKHAIKETAILIENLFKFENRLKLKEPIISPKVLKVDFIINRVCAFADGKVSEINELDTDMFVDELNKIYNKRFFERDFDMACQDRKRIYRRLNGKRGRNV